jgi:aminoglycoside phosphotransferase family enzyme
LHGRAGDRDSHFVRPAHGRYAYKIKKAVDLEFIDFTTLAARHFYCDRELELNRPLAPLIYLEVVAITGTIDVPRIGGDGPALVSAVTMLVFTLGRSEALAGSRVNSTPCPTRPPET